MFEDSMFTSANRHLVFDFLRHKSCPSHDSNKFHASNGAMIIIPYLYLSIFIIPLDTKYLNKLITLLKYITKNTFYLEFYDIIYKLRFIILSAKCWFILN